MDQLIPDHYAALGISRNAVAQDIKIAFFALAKTYHPDKNNGGPTNEFIKVEYFSSNNRGTQKGS